MTFDLLSQLLNSPIISIPHAPHPYIDPNTGGMLFQVLAVFLAFFSGILFFFSRQIKTTFARLKRKLRKEQPLENPVEPDQKD